LTDVQIKALTKTFDEKRVRAVDDLTLTVEEGQLLVLLGPSGCGKTTLLRCLAGLERPESGSISFGGQTVFSSGMGPEADVPTHKRGIGMVFQNYALWPHMTVEQNVAYPLKFAGVERKDRGQRARAALALVECEELAARTPSAISGGQQQRIALARALVGRPQLLLFDEPLSNLDYRLRAQLRTQIRELHHDLRFTGVYVTHDQTEAMQLGSRVAVLRDGRVEQLATPEDLFGQPASAYVARFLGLTNCLTLRRAEGSTWSVGSGTGSITLPGELPGDSYELFVRSTDVSLAAPTADLPSADTVSIRGTVEDVVFSGETVDWIIKVGDARLNAVGKAGSFPFRTGDDVAVQFRVADMLVYETDEAGQLVPLKQPVH
jgi:iron(III) transport system ATP-binding protein